MAKRYWLPAVGTAIGLGGLLAYFRLRARPKAVSHDTEASEAALEVRTRAYLTLTSTKFKWNVDGMSPDAATIAFEWTNVGQTPARNVGFSHAVEFVPAQLAKDRSPNPAFIWNSKAGALTLEPGESVSMDGGMVPASMTRRWIAGEHLVLVYSAVVYTDASGKENRVETCTQAICQLVGGERLVKLKTAEFNNSTMYGTNANDP